MTCLEMTKNHFRTMEQIEIICLASGSTGNCYAFRKHNEIVLVEVGVDYNIVCSMLINQEISPLEIKVGICTHRHKDHSLSISDLEKRGIHVYNDFQSGDIFDGAKIKLTEWLKVYCFKVNHDVDAYGFVFYDTENKQSILFINDTFEFLFPLKKIPFDIVMIECNFIQTQLDAMKRSNPKTSFKFARQEKCHLSLLGTKNMLSQMNLSKTKVIILMHLSLDCANETAMKTEIQTVFNIRTLIARKNGGLQ